jgi:hypothetical protein
MKKYKVWAEIEEIDEEEDIFERVGGPDLIGEFDTPEEAEEFVASLT